MDIAASKEVGDELVSFLEQSVLDFVSCWGAEKNQIHTLTHRRQKSCHSFSTLDIIVLIKVEETWCLNNLHCLVLNLYWVYFSLFFVSIFEKVRPADVISYSGLTCILHSNDNNFLYWWCLFLPPINFVCSFQFFCSFFEQYRYGFIFKGQSYNFLLLFNPQSTFNIEFFHFFSHTVNKPLVFIVFWIQFFLNFFPFFVMEVCWTQSARFFYRLEFKNRVKIFTISWDRLRFDQFLQVFSIRT